MVKVGFEPTNHKGPALEAGGFDRFPTPPKDFKVLSSTKREVLSLFIF